MTPAAPSIRESPPVPRPPRLVLRVGLTGHRPSGLGEADLVALRSRVRGVLAQLRAIVTTAGAEPGEDFLFVPPELRLISALAEGADCLGAQEALAEGYALQAPLPFPRELYEHDFRTAASLEEFRALLARASAVLELDGTRENDGMAYAHVGRVILSQSDVLVAVWNGESSHGSGGTAHVAHEAISLGVPVLWINSRAPHDLCFLRTSLDGTISRRPLSELPEEVLRLLWPERVSTHRALHRHEDLGDARHHPMREMFYRQSLVPEHRISVYNAFLRLFERGGTHRAAVSVDPPPVVTRPEAKTQYNPFAPSLASLVADYERADLLAEHYGGKYRDTFVGNYLLGALAVIAALIGFVTPAGTLIELVLIVLIIVLTRRGKRKHWHRRWIGYRLLAEQLRMLELLLPIGRVPPSFRAPPHTSSVDTGHFWVTWLVRARAREIGLADGRLDEAYLERYRQMLLSTIAGQAAYHRRSAHRSERLTHTVHATTTFIFFTALLVCVVHLGVDFFRAYQERSAKTRKPFFAIDSLTAAAGVGNAFLTALAAALPALGAALAGILGQGEFDRTARHSHAVAAELYQLAARLDRTDGSLPLRSDVCASVAVNVAETMSAELLDWQVTFRSKTLELPL